MEENEALCSRVYLTHPRPPLARSAVETRWNTAWSRIAAEPRDFQSPPRPAASLAFDSWRCGCFSGRVPAATAHRSLDIQGKKNIFKMNSTFSLWCIFLSWIVFPFSVQSLIRTKTGSVFFWFLITLVCTIQSIHQHLWAIHILQCMCVNRVELPWESKDRGGEKEKWVRSVAQRPTGYLLISVTLWEHKI